MNLSKGAVVRLVSVEEMDAGTNEAVVQRVDEL